MPAPDNPQRPKKGRFSRYKIADLTLNPPKTVSPGTSLYWSPVVRFCFFFSCFRCFIEPDSVIYGLRTAKIGQTFRVENADFRLLLK